ncbi:KICSTOR complex protein C12orf66 homolog [Anoplophora glabripennis]|uniref:KICSTOR complex protein C12orf66 homolog n=1 Tax=Anoplophora glabripennis TaxID=217634 RepID=UPI000C764F87|nr:KICSTOR complex protein C12orf66 homolog [Anoplophora glabripennis]
MEKEDEILYIYFTHISQLCFEKAKEHIEREKEPKSVTPWNTFLNFLQQLALAEKSYIEIGFLQNKHKSFLRKDVSSVCT